VLWPAHEMAYHAKEFSGTLYLNHLNSVLFMLVGLASAAGMVLSRPSLRNAVISVVPFLLMAHAMLIGRARSSFVGLAAFVLMLFRRMRVLFLILALGCVALPLLRSFGVDVVKGARDLWQQRVLDRLKGRRMESISDLTELQNPRFEIWKETLVGIGEKPYILITGAGFQNYGFVNRKAVAAHNQYLHVVVELGLGGLFLYGWLIVAIWKQLAAVGRQSREMYYLISLPGTACLAAILAVGMLNETLYASRAIPGFMGFFLAYFAVGTHRAWFAEAQGTVDGK
ncbi:MAG: O-antigen ligase family protein, partial [Kiritimatiellae bacterium]|nr:O-antigen ligase family protein [Kiritimatiellia bacterium]